MQNIMFDPVLNKTFVYTSPDSQTLEWFGQNKLIEPIWATNQRGGNGRKSAAEWLGANLGFSNQSIKYVPYNHSRPYRELIDQFVGFFTDKEDPVNFAALYFDEPDHTGHLYGKFQG